MRASRRPRAGLVLERHAEQLELLDQRSDAHAEDQPPAADDVERAVALRDLERVVVAEDENVGREPDPLGPRRQVAEGGKRIPVRRTSSGASAAGTPMCSLHVTWS